MKRTRKAGDIRPEYDFSKGVRGKYAARAAGGSNVVLLDPDMTTIFPDSAAVNEALRLIAPLVRKYVKRSAAGTSSKRRASR